VINSIEWYRQYQEYFHKQGFCILNLQANVGQEFQHQLGKLMPVTTPCRVEFQIDITLLASSREAVMEALHSEYFLNEFELSLVMVSESMSSDTGLCEVQATFTQEQPTWEWQEA